ncbi:MAG: hypothetical protein ACFCUU_07140 [Cyclobacteriaceae bacterium]
MKYLSKYILGIIAIAAFAACEVEDPFVDRVEAPLLVEIMGISGWATFATEPSVGFPASSPQLTLGARFLELDKTHILDYTKGIDSIPVANLPITIALRSGVVLGEVTTDASGVAQLSKTWSELGLATPAAGQVVRLTWSGEHKGIAFSRYSQIQAQ